MRKIRTRRTIRTIRTIYDTSKQLLRTRATMWVLTFGTCLVMFWVLMEPLGRAGINPPDPWVGSGGYGLWIWVDLSSQWGVVVLQPIFVISIPARPGIRIEMTKVGCNSTSPHWLLKPTYFPRWEFVRSGTSQARIGGCDSDSDRIMGHILISQNVFFNSLLESQIPHNICNLFFTINNLDNKLTILWGCWLS